MQMSVQLRNGVALDVGINKNVGILHADDVNLNRRAFVLRQPYNSSLRSALPVLPLSHPLMSVPLYG
jgi:hypothetical protein